MEKASKKYMKSDSKDRIKKNIQMKHTERKERRHTNKSIKKERINEEDLSRRTNNSQCQNLEEPDKKSRKSDEESKSKLEKSENEHKKPDFGLSGKLAEDTNVFNGVVIKYSEPPEARMPKKRWRLYPFKGDQSLPTLYIHRQSAYLLGRDRKIADIPIDHPSCSKQHAALQYRLVSYNRPNGTLGKQIRLYIIDLESANGTYINNNKIEARKYVELFEKDVIKFGFSSREYVLLHEHSKDEENSED